jgi:RNA polymerase sigma-70 factor (ECF subfamily)
MAFLPEAAVPEDYGPFVAFRNRLGFLPNLFRAQTLLPRAIEAEAGIAECVLFGDKALSRMTKESVILTIAGANATPYCLAAHRHVLLAAGRKEADLDRMVTDVHRAALPANETQLLDFCRRLAVHPRSIGSQDIQELRDSGFSDEAILEAIQTTALGQFLCTLATGVGAEPDFETGPVPDRGNGRKELQRPLGGKPNGGPGPYLRYVERTERDFPPFAFFRESFGFVPNIFRAQTLSPDVVEAEARVVDTVLLSEDVLRRVQKEYVLLAISAANLNTYCVAVHCEMLRGLGIPEETSDQIALDHHLASLSEADTTLLDFALKLATKPTEYGAADVALLRGLGFSDTQVLEAVVMTSLTQFLNTLQMGLGTIPDMEPRLVFDSPRHQAGTESPPADEDTELVARSQAGDVAAFEELVLRHVGRIYRTVVRIVGKNDAEDEVQNAFLKAFEHIKEFRGGSRFSTWLTRIAINEALSRHRKSMKEETLEEDRLVDEEQPFRPRHLHRWAEDPELAYSRQETRELVDRALMNLPTKYRLPVLLRDVEELSSAEAASVLGLPLATMKTQLLRGRMMLREALAPHFSRQDRGIA